MAGAQEVRSFEALCPPGVFALDPLVIPLEMPVRRVLNIRVRIPPGPNGLMGFAIGSAGTTVIPINDDEYIRASDEIFEWALTGQIDSGAWQAIMINEGIYDHTIYITFTVELPDLPAGATALQPIGAVLLTPPPAIITPVTPVLPPPPPLPLPVP